MRRILFTMLAAGVLSVAVPTVAFARHHHSSHHRHRSHTRIRHERFGSTATTGTAGTATAPTAGTVSSFASGLLTIKLTDGTQVSGMVTSDTELECQAAAPAEMQSDDQGGGDTNSGDTSTGGDQGDDQGDDQGEDQGEDQGDDQGEDQQCAPSALVINAVVQEAELSISSAGSVWAKVELAGA